MDCICTVGVQKMNFEEENSFKSYKILISIEKSEDTYLY